MYLGYSGLARVILALHTLERASKLTFGLGSRRLLGVLVEPVVTLCLEAGRDVLVAWPLIMRHLKRAITEQVGDSSTS